MSTLDSHTPAALSVSWLFDEFLFIFPFTNIIFIDNPDCRGDVEKTVDSDMCANSGWALWYIPDGGYNSFCCLPGQYGYWYPSLGQDAVGQCSSSSTLPTSALPGTQVNNGDGTVDSSGVQIVALVAANETCDGYGICKSTAEPAPTCDVIHYGWSLQSNTSTCTTGSNLCSYSGVNACCPEGLTCGTVIGDSEVPVCCPPGNPDCRGDVEGLWPQVCADSSWALWHVNTNGNHFCCKPGEIGYNRINDVYATGYCGTAVPRNSNTTVWMRSILDYEGDGSQAGSHLSFPCDSSPAPNASFASMCNAILNPPATLNPYPVTLSSALYPNVVTVYLPTATPTVYRDSPYAPGAAGNSGNSGSGSGSSASGNAAVSSSKSYGTTVYETVCTTNGVVSTISVTSVVSKATATPTSSKVSASALRPTTTGALFTGAASANKVGGVMVAVGMAAALL